MILQNPGCKACTNSAYNCDPETGQCICPHLSKGADCHECYPNAWGWEHKIGCRVCDCDLNGAIGQTCDLYTGQCVCREGFTGRRCDSCALGYYGYPNCDRCNCNREGSLWANGTNIIPCNERGECECKTLVIGTKCDRCSSSTFGLSHANADGCTRCFCFDRSNECEQSNLSWGQIRTTNVRNVSVNYRNGEYAVLTRNDGQGENVVMKMVNGLTVLPGTSG